MSESLPITRKWLLLIAWIILLAAPVNAGSDNITGNINLAVGVLHTADNFAKAFDLNNRFEIGANTDVKKETWPVSIAFDYMFSYGDSKISKNAHGKNKDMDTDLYSSEMYVGAKKLFEHFSCGITPFVGAGLFTVNMYVDTGCDDEYDWGIGGWIGAGAYLKLPKQVNVGLEWKWSSAQIDIFNKEYNAGGNHFDLMLGRHF